MPGVGPPVTSGTSSQCGGCAGSVCQQRAPHASLCGQIVDTIVPPRPGAARLQPVPIRGDGSAQKGRPLPYSGGGGGIREGDAQLLGRRIPDEDGFVVEGGTAVLLGKQGAGRGLVVGGLETKLSVWSWGHRRRASVAGTPNQIRSYGGNSSTRPAHTERRGHAMIARLLLAWSWFVVTESRG
jgi:hypothetical protein